MNIEQEYNTELARQIAGLKSKFTVKQLAMADYQVRVGDRIRVY